METKKKKRSPYSKRKRFILGIIALVSIFAVKVLLTPVTCCDPPPGTTEFKTSLDPEYIPTAEYLIEHPVPDKLAGNMSIARISVMADAEFQGICVALRPPLDTADEFWESTEIYLNNRLTSFAGRNDMALCLLTTGVTDCISRCAGGAKVADHNDYDGFNGWLELGVHLIEVRMKYHPDDEPFHIQKWGFRIEE